jgi:hypothetical protein
MSDGLIALVLEMGFLLLMFLICSWILGIASGGGGEEETVRRAAPYTLSASLGQPTVRRDAD